MAFQFNQGDRPLTGYTIQRGVGRGGFGEVYYATSDGGKEVALKYLRENPQIEIRGATHCLNLKSPYLVALHDIKQNADGDFFVIMEYVDGPSLRDLLTSAATDPAGLHRPGSPQQPPAGAGGFAPQPPAAAGGLGPQKAAYFLREIGKGLAYLHDRGIVHRDLKPGNIFYEDGYVKIGDYGLAKMMAASQHSGQTVSVGTVHYMAPEVGSGNYDRTIDIYALGVVLYEMLLGRVPFSGATMGEVLMKHLTAQPAVDELPEPFPGVIRKALAKDPKDRYQTVSEMLGDVFAVEDLDRSVAAFEPASLSQAAARVAEQVAAQAVGQGVHPADPVATPRQGHRLDTSRLCGPGALGTGSSNVGMNGPPPVIDPRPTADRMGGAARAEARGSSPAGRFGQIRDRISARADYIADRIDDSPVGRHVAAAAQRRGHWAERIFIALLVAAGISYGTSLLVDNGCADFAFVLFLHMIAIVPGVILGCHLCFGRLRIEGKWLPRLIIAACSGACVVPAMFISDEALHVHWVNHLIPPLLFSLFMCDWAGRFREGRMGRVCLGPAITAGLFGFVAAFAYTILAPTRTFGFALGDYGFAVAAIVAGASLALQAVAGLWPLPARTSPAGSGPICAADEADCCGASPAAVGVGRRGPAEAGVAVQPGGLPTRPMDRAAAAAGAGEGPRRSTAVRSIWLAVAVLLLFGSVLSFSAIGLLSSLSSDDEAGYCVAGVVGSVYFLFALSRVFSRRKTGLWRGVLRPAIFFTGLAAAAGSGTAWLMFSFRGDNELAALAAILAGGLVSLFVWFVPVPAYVPQAPVVPTDDADEQRRRRGRRQMKAGGILLGVVMILLVPILAVLVDDNSLDEEVMVAVIVPLTSFAITILVVGALRSRPANRAWAQKLGLPLRSVFEIDPNPNLSQLIERHLTMLGYRLDKKSDRLWSFSRGNWTGQFWQSNIRQWGAKLNIAAYDLDTGRCRLSCYLDVESAFNGPGQKQIAVLHDELQDLKDLLGGRDAPQNRPEALA